MTTLMDAIKSYRDAIDSVGLTQRARTARQGRIERAGQRLHRLYLSEASQCIAGRDWEMACANLYEAIQHGTWDRDKARDAWHALVDCGYEFDAIQRKQLSWMAKRLDLLVSI